MALNEDDPVRYWREKAEEQGRLIERLEKASEVRIVGLRRTSRSPSRGAGS